MIAEATYLPIVLVFLILSAFLVAGVIENRKTKDDSLTIVAYIESQDFFKALERCKSLKPKKLLKQKNKIVDAIKRRLNYCITYSAYKSGLYWIDLRTIMEMQTYKTMLKLFPEEEKISEIIEILEKIIELEKFSKWNDYFAEDDAIFSEVKTFIERGDSLIDVSLEKAKKYYETALSGCERASLVYFNDKNYGFKETADFYEAYAKIIKRKIENSNSTEEEIFVFEQAKSAFLAIYEEYLSALKEYDSLIKTFPSSVC